MRLNVMCTPQGLTPMYDADYDEKKKLKVGSVYSCEIRQMRNVQFHRKYFALIKTAWAYQSAAREEFFHHNEESFRKTIEIAAGYCDKVYSVTRGEWMDVPKSIAFDKMDETEFEELYERVKDVLFTMFLDNITEEEFMKKLVNF